MLNRIKPLTLATAFAIAMIATMTVPAPAQEVGQPSPPEAVTLDNAPLSDDVSASSFGRKCNTWYQGNQLSNNYSRWLGPTWFGIGIFSVESMSRYQTQQYNQHIVYGPADDYIPPRTQRYKKIIYGGIHERTMQRDRVQIKPVVSVGPWSANRVYSPFPWSTWERVPPHPVGGTGTCYIWVRTRP